MSELVETARFLIAVDGLTSTHLIVWPAICVGISLSVGVVINCLPERIRLPIYRFLTS